jgi:hypothetical protein
LQVPNALAGSHRAVVDTAAIAREMQRLGQVVGAADSDLPTIGPSLRDAHPYVEVDAERYHYVVNERGVETERLSTPSLDELLYRVACDLTFSIAVAYELRHRVHGQDARRVMFARQVELLHRVSHDWAVRQAAEHEEILSRHPFVD